MTLVVSPPVRAIDVYRWQACRLDFGFAYLIKLAAFELQCQTQAERLAVDDDDPPPLWFIRSMYGAQALDDLNRRLTADALCAFAAPGGPHLPPEGTPR